MCDLAHRTSQRPLTSSAATGKWSLNTPDMSTCTDMLACFLQGGLSVSVSVSDFLWHSCVNKPERGRKAAARTGWVKPEFMGKKVGVLLMWQETLKRKKKMMTVQENKRKKINGGDRMKRPRESTSNYVSFQKHQMIKSTSFIIYMHWTKMCEDFSQNVIRIIIPVNYGITNCCKVWKEDIDDKYLQYMAVHDVCHTFLFLKTAVYLCSVWEGDIEYKTLKILLLWPLRNYSTHSEMWQLKKGKSIIFKIPLLRNNWEPNSSTSASSN